MNLRELIPSLCIAGAMVGAAVPAGAYPYGDHWRDRGAYQGGWRDGRGGYDGYYRSGWHGDRDGYDGYYRSGWRDDRGWRGSRRHHGDCWMEWRHHHRVRVCR